MLYNEVTRDIMLILHFIGIAMAVGTGFAQMFLGIAASKMGEEAPKFMLKTLYLRNMGRIGLILLILSGLFLMTPYWTVVLSQHILLTKLVLVAFIIVLFGMIEANAARAIQENGGPSLLRLRKIGPLLLLTSLLVIIIAVMYFH